MQLARTGRRSASKSRAVRAMVSQTVSAPKREKDPKKRVVITGMGLVSVFGSGIDTFYDKLLEGESGISLIDRFDASSFSVRFAGQIRDSLPKDTLMKGYKKMSPFFIPYSITNTGSALLAIDTGLMGPNYSISTACATANDCFYLAANHIRRGEADIMIMESLEHAMKRGANIIAEYLGGAVTCDAHHMTDPRSDGLGVSTCIAKSLEDAGVSPEEVNYVNAHATSTLAEDLAEVNAIKKVV
ncbi:hypothetical protein OIU76_017696 [Salix suchowensis]|nr:hypothetical protein OIU76_017696 [Salix suchowensis]